MKITNKIISEVVGDLLGEEAVNIALFVKQGQKVSEFAVAKAMKMDLHQARAILYKLYEQNILIFERRKDRQKGWYITYWDFFPDNINHIYKNVLKNKLQKLKERLEKETNSDFYMCKNTCTRMDFEKAINFNFKCPECGSLMNPVDNKRTIEFLQEKIADLRKELNEINNQKKEFEKIQNEKTNIENNKINLKKEKKKIKKKINKQKKAIKNKNKK